MSQLTLRDVPDELHAWLKSQAVANRRSLNQEVIVRLEALRRQPPAAVGPAERLKRMRRIASQAARLPLLDTRSEAEIVGYGEDGLPG